MKRSIAGLRVQTISVSPLDHCASQRLEVIAIHQHWPWGLHYWGSHF